MFSFRNLKFLKYQVLRTKSVSYYITQFYKTFNNIKFKSSLQISPENCKKAKTCEMKTFFTLFPKRNKGSLTIEASMAIPLFIFFVFQIISLVHFYHEDSRRIAQDTEKAKNAAMYMYMADQTTNVKQYLYNENVDVIQVKKTKGWYEMVPYKDFYTVDRATCKMWTGYDTKNGEEAKKREVYMTKNTEVYHLSPNCSYLTPKVHEVKKENIENERSKSGEIYSPCQWCGKKKANEELYVTDYGNKYHTKRDCTAILHEYEKESLQNAEKEGKRVCGKCAERSFFQ